jgi:D-glycero-D-manno-heptose 1,7-bisphosphate phosphatase
VNRAVFLDRDGTLIEEKGYVCHFSEVVVFPFAVEALQRFNELNYRTVIVTNQSAVARGICSEREVRNLHEELRLHFQRRGAVIDAVYFCPFLEMGVVERYRARHSLRKPSPGMLIQAAEDLGIDLRSSWMIGDSAIDIEAGIDAGCRTVLVRTGKGKIVETERTDGFVQPDRIEDDILAAARAIARLSRSRRA